MPSAVIVSACRTPVGRARKGALAGTRPGDLGALVLREALARAGGVEPGSIDDVILGCACPETEQSLNVGRLCALAAGLPDTGPAMAVNRCCACAHSRPTFRLCSASGKAQPRITSSI